ncbi:hypothetical protein [Streptomyces sp. NPDC054797]
MRLAYRKQGLWGFLDHRTTRASSPTGRADERIVAAVREALRRQRGRSKGTIDGLFPLINQILEARHGAGAVPAPCIRIHRRTCNADLLAPYHGQPSPIAGRGGKGEIHYNPHDVRQIWIQPARQPADRDPVDLPRPRPPAVQRPHLAAHQNTHPAAAPSSLINERAFINRL